MKRSSSFHLLFSISLILFTAACSTSFNKSPTPTSSLVPTNTPEPTSTATPQPTVPPEILDLEGRLGNGYQVIRGATGQLLFIQDEKVISEIDVEGHLSFRHGNEVVVATCVATGDACCAVGDDVPVFEEQEARIIVSSNKQHTNRFFNFPHYG